MYESLTECTTTLNQCTPLSASTAPFTQCFLDTGKIYTHKQTIQSPRGHYSYVHCALTIPCSLAPIYLQLLPPSFCPFNGSNFMPCSLPLSASLSKADRRIPLLFKVLKPLSRSDSLLSFATATLWLHTSPGSHCVLTDYCHSPSTSACSPSLPPQHAYPLSNPMQLFFLTSYPSTHPLKALSADIHS